MPSASRLCARCNRKRTPQAFPSARARVCKSCTRARIQKDNRAKRLQTTYGITLEEYAALLAAQDGRCAGCGGLRRYNLHVDHDHKVERQLLADGVPPEDAARRSIRGLLCARCNKTLRDVRDDAPRLVRLAHYLHEPPAKRVLGVAA